MHFGSKQFWLWKRKVTIICDENHRGLMVDICPQPNGLTRHRVHCSGEECLCIASISYILCKPRKGGQEFKPTFNLSVVHLSSMKSNAF